MQIPGGALDLAPLIPVVAILVWGFLKTMRGPIGQALADRLRGSSSDDMAGELEALREEVVALRADLEETQERQDFSERLLSQGSMPPKRDEL